MIHHELIVGVFVQIHGGLKRANIVKGSSYSGGNVSVSFGEILHQLLVLKVSIGKILT